MKLICKKNDLLSGVNITMKAVSSKTTMSILECFLIDATEGKIKMTANDMELGIETVVQGEIIEPGSVAIEAKLFSEIIRKLPDNDVVIDVDNEYKANITCENAKFNIIGRDGDDFSYLPEIKKEKSISISQFSLKEVIRQTIFSIDDKNNNKLMTGELFEISGNNLKVVALDGHRIAIRNIELNAEYEDIKVVVPGKTLNEISKILNGGVDDIVNIYFTTNHILFEFDNTRVVSRLLEGEYYKISQMLSSDYETKITINKKEFLNCIDRASLLIRESDKKPIIIDIADHSLKLIINKREMLDCIDRATLLIKEGDKKPIIITIKDGVMEFKINSFIGSMDEEIYIQKEGKDMMIGFNPRFLIDTLKVIDEEQINIYYVNPKSPCFIRDDEGKYIYLILPVNFSVANN